MAERTTYGCTTTWTVKVAIVFVVVLWWATCTQAWKLIPGRTDG